MTSTIRISYLQTMRHCLFISKIMAFKDILLSQPFSVIEADSAYFTLGKKFRLDMWQFCLLILTFYRNACIIYLIRYN